MNLKSMDNIRFLGRSVLLTICIGLSISFSWPNTDISEQLRDAMSIPFFATQFILVFIAPGFVSHVISPVWNKVTPVKDKATFIENEIVWAICVLIGLPFAGLIFNMIDFTGVVSAIKIILPSLIVPMMFGYGLTRYFYSRENAPELPTAQTIELANAPLNIKPAIAALLASFTYCFVCIGIVSAVIALKSIASIGESGVNISNIGLAATNTWAIATGLAGLMGTLFVAFALFAGTFQRWGFTLRQKLRPKAQLAPQMGTDFAIGLIAIQSVFIVWGIIQAVMSGHGHHYSLFSLAVAAIIMTMSAFVAAGAYDLIGADNPVAPQ